VRRKIPLAITLLLIAGAILYLQNPRLLPAWLGGGSGENDAVLGMIENPAQDQVGLEVGKAAPDFALRTLEGAVVRLSDFRGRQHVIVNFWASWCGPCKVEMPDLEAVYRQHKDQLVVLGVDLQESDADVRRFLSEEIQVSYPILMDDRGRVAQAYNKFAQPTSFLIDQQGIIRSRKNGAYTSEELQQRVQELLAASDVSLHIEHTN